MKKEKPLIQHPTDPLSTQSELPVPQPLFDDRSMNLSEKEIIDLFEKMMVSVVLFCQELLQQSNGDAEQRPLLMVANPWQIKNYLDVNVHANIFFFAIQVSSCIF